MLQDPNMPQGGDAPADENTPADGAADEGTAATDENAGGEGAAV